MATISILRWKASGLRCPDHEIAFEDDTGLVPITLLQMPNGTGKTTTLALLRATLGGTWSKWSPEMVREFKKRSGTQAAGSFELVSSIGGIRYTFALRFDFDAGIIKGTTTGPAGIAEGFRVPAGVHNFLRPDFVSFFVFDGELAENLLRSTQSDAQRAIEGLFRLDLFGGMCNRVDDLWNAFVARRGAKDSKGLTQRQNRLQKLRERLAILTAEKAHTSSELAGAREQLRAKRDSFNSALTVQREMKAKVVQSEADFRQAEEEVRQAALSLHQRIRDPQAVSQYFAAELVAFKESLDRVKLPESSAREFFEELSQEAKCVCGRPIDEEAKQCIKERSKYYLGTDDIAALNQIKGDIGNAMIPGISAAEDDLTVRMERLRLARRARAEKQTTRDQVKAEAIGEDPRLGQIQSDIDSLQAHVKELEAALEKYGDTTDQALNDDQVCGLKVLQRRIDDAEEKLAEVTETLEVKAKRDVLISILEKIGNRAKVAISSEICLQTNDKIQQLMPDNHIRISKIDSYLHLDGQEAGSTGETLTVGYSFLSTLFNRADQQLPFIVDSPANPIDLRVRSRVAQLIPRLGHQFIAFTISSEREGFFTALDRAAQGKVRYVTMFRKSAVASPKIDRAEFVETADGFAVYGKEFFQNFHVEEDSGNG